VEAIGGEALALPLPSTSGAVQGRKCTVQSSSLFLYCHLQHMSIQTQLLFLEETS
jgi:hypothetical protein